MGTFKICRIETYNFKGFLELHLDLSDNAYFILGGKNGYGKTTIFDGIELIITGEIQRLLVFNDFSDKRGRLSDFKKPLVHDMNVDTVSVEILVEKDGSRFWLKREARTEQMTNPLTFQSFKTLYFSEDSPKTERNYREISEDELTELLSKSIISKYGFIYYLDQENSDQFLKSTSKLRREKISSIFNIESFEFDLKKLETCKHKLSGLKDKYSLKLAELDNDKRRIEASLRTEDYKDVPYIQLSNAQGWDSDKLQLEADVLNALVGPNGLLTEAVYYIQNIEGYKQYCLKRDALPFQNEQTRRDISAFIQYANEKDMLELHDVYSELCMKMDQCTDLNIIEQILSERKAFLVKQIEENSLLSIIETIKDINLQTKQLSDLQKNYLNLWHQREQILKEFKSTAFQNVTNCPICGHEYGDRALLLEHINQQGELLKVMVDKMGATNLSRLTEFKKRFNAELLDGLKAILSDKGIDANVVNAIRNPRYRQFMTNLVKRYGISIERAESLALTYDNVMTVFNKINDYAGKDIDFNRLEAFHLTQLRNFNLSMFTIENIELKREYILSQWSVQSSTILVKLKKQIAMHKALVDDIESKLGTISSIVSSIKKQQKAYIQKLISDIEILFYIYSGRIMQNCHYGRGVFLKYDEKANVLFTAGDRDHDVDVLLNMSSGQISAVIISFMLAINKLYADHRFMAIDDPVQTMDDMNIWGLIETLRHEFRDYTVLMSTHEQPFGSLIRYKASKMGIPSYYLDMRSLRTINQDTDEMQNIIDH